MDAVKLKFLLKVGIEMAEYIEREKVLGIINELQNVCATEVPEDKTDIYNDVFDEVYGEMRTIPAADVRPERHGRWISQKGSENFIPFVYHPPERWKCSLCDCGVNDDRFCYCPECGAKMDGKDGEDNVNL